MRANTLENVMKKVFLLAAALALSAGCAQTVGDLDRTAPDYYPKAWFTGSWYMRPTIIRTQYHQAFFFEGLEGEMEKVRWEMQESQLIAWRDYEKLPNTEGNPGSHTPVAIFGVTHLDVKRDYNPSNGVETNVIVENTTDRPWWEREFVRVDWSRNMVHDYNINTYVRVLGMDIQAINRTDDKYEAERPRISDKYIDVVTRVTMVSDWTGDYSLYQPSMTDVRWSFRKIDGNNGYEPLLYPDYLPVKVKYRYARKAGVDGYEPCTPSPNDPHCEIYGGAPSSGPEGVCRSHSATPTANWNNTALCHVDTTLDQDCFCTSEPQDLFVDGNGNICDSRLRDNIDVEDCTQITYPIFERFGFFRTLRMPFDWERSFTFNGRIYLANRWHIWERSKDANGAVIPYAQRTPKPVVYYTNPEWPEDLMGEGQNIANEWSDALRETVAELQGKSKDEVGTMFELRRNGCTVENVKNFARNHEGMESVLEAAVGGVDRVEMGNLKRACTALEVESKGAFEWQRVGDLRYSFMHWVHTPQQAGPLGFGPSSADPETGEIISANAYLYGAAVDTYANFAADMVQLLNNEVSPQEFLGGDNVVAEISKGRTRVNEGLSKRATRQQMQRFEQLEASDPAGYSMRLPSARELNGADPRSHVAFADQNMRLRALDQFAQEHLVNDDMLRVFAGPDRYQPGQQPTADALSLASPARWGQYPDQTRRMGSSLGDQPLANEMAMGALDEHARLERFMAEHTIETGEMLVEPAVYGLAVKLKGKTRDEVVQYARRKIVRAVEAHEVGHTLGLRHNFAGSSDPLNFIENFWTEPELSQDPESHKWDYAYSSIMDYHQRFSSDWSGIGPYDRAAIKFGYGQLLEVFDKTREEFPVDYFNFATSVLDYKDLPTILSTPNFDNTFEQAYYDALAGTTPVLTVPKNQDPEAYKHLYKRKNVQFKDIWADYNADLFGGYSQTGDYLGNYEAQYQVVPYGFCSDLYAWGGNLNCNRYDMGANVQEIVSNAREMYDAYYLFNNFRRDRFMFLGGPMSFSVNGYLSRLYDRTYQPMLNSFRYFYYYRRSLLMMYPLIQDWASAALDGMNFFGKVLQTPEPGSYCNQFGTYVRGGGCDSPITIPVGEGRYFGTSWTDEYYYKATRIGSYWDKWMAILALTDSQFFLVRNFSSLFDRGAFSITYYRVYEKEMTDLFRSLMEGDMSRFSATVEQDMETGQWRVVNRPLVGASESEAPNAPKIRPAISWNLQKQAALYAGVGFTSTVDRKMDFARRMRVTYLGANDDPLYEGFDPNDILTFTDPVTHLTYRAAPVGGDDAPGFVMVGRTKDFHDNVWLPSQTALESADATLAALRNDPSVPADVLAEAVEARDTAQVEFNSADRELREMVDLLEYVRILGKYLHLYFD